MTKSYGEKRAVSMDCKYSYVVAVVKRAKEIRRESKEKNLPIGDIATVKTSHVQPLTVALEEFDSGNIELQLKVSSEKLDKEDESDFTEVQPKGEEAASPSENKESEMAGKMA